MRRDADVAIRPVLTRDDAPAMRRGAPRRAAKMFDYAAMPPYLDFTICRASPMRYFAQR